MRFGSRESFGNTKAIDRIRHRLTSLDSSSDLLQEDLGDSPVASPQLEESLYRGGGVSLIEIVCVSEDGFPSSRERSTTPATIGHRPGLSGMPAVCCRRSDAVRL